MLLYHKNKGFVILIVLIFMQVFILLNWYAINDVLLLTKFTKNTSDHDFLFYQTKKILAHIELTMLSTLPTTCMISFVDSDELIEKPLNWWREKSCSGNFQTFKYYYVVEPLSIDNCASIEHAEPAVAEYFRITLFLQSAIDDTRFFLQSTLVRPYLSAVPVICAGQRHQVQMGRQAWRELVY